jgi:hypothetical protein
VLAVVILNQFWADICTKVKLIEPFMKLAMPHGVPAKDALHMFYLSSNIIPDPIIALCEGHWVVLWASLGHVAVSFLVPVASEMIHLDIEDVDLRLSIDIVVARVTQGILAYVTVMTLAVMYQKLRKPSRLHSDPSSIASMAALVHHPEVIEDFRTFSDNVSIEEIRMHLGDKRYKLDEYQRPDGIWRYGLVPVVPATGAGGFHYRNESATKLRPLKTSNSKNSLNAILDWVFAALILALVAVIVAYLKDGTNSGFSLFFNSNSFGPRFILTTAGTIIAKNWNRLEQGTSFLTKHLIVAANLRGRRPCNISILSAVSISFKPKDNDSRTKGGHCHYFHTPNADQASFLCCYAITGGCAFSNPRRYAWSNPILITSSATRAFC